jgi:glutaredoxin
MQLFCKAFSGCFGSSSSFSGLAPFAVAVCLGCTSAAALGQAYRWVDKDGRVHYSDTKPPPATARNVDQISTHSGAVSSAQPLGYALQQAMKANPVKLYTFSGCKTACSDAKALLEKRGVPYTEISVDAPGKRDELKRVSGGTNVPVLVVGTTVKQGYEASMYEAALDEGGYPKSSQLLPGQQARQEEKPAPRPAAAAAPAEKPKGPYAPR